MRRERLRAERMARGMTQQRVAEELGMSLRNYQAIEAGSVMGRIGTWDALEDLLGVSQRELRRSGPAASPS